MTPEWIIAALAVIAVNLTDIWSTRKFLALGIKEANGIWRKAQKALGKWWGVPKMLIAMSMTFLGWWADQIIVPVIIVIGLAGVTAWNMRAIKRAKE